jgi:hypothetical protein
MAGRCTNSSGLTRGSTGASIDHELFQRRETDRLLRKLHDGGMKNLTEGEQTRLYELVAEAEHAKRMTLAVRALGGISWHRRPDLIRKIADLYQQMLSATEVRRMFERLFQLPESERDASAEGFYAELRRRTIAAVGDSAYGSAYDAEEATYRAATAISDDRIRLTLRLPGEIVAGNATVENGVAKWDFDAKDLYKGDVTLRAVSIRP